MMHASGAIAKPELMCPESTTAKSMRPSGSGDLALNSPGHKDSGFALKPYLDSSNLIGTAEAVPNHKTREKHFR